ncbi:peptidase, partial [Pseudomonas sp. MWU12-2323]|nr:peptidase [Pseudomonas sp. MWU12-2323]
RYVQIFALETAEAATRLDIFHCLSAEEKVIAAHESLAYGIAHEMRQIVFADDVKHWKVSGG